MRPIITLTTDFGVSDAYVAAMKGVLLTRCPEAEIVDITHGVEAQNVAQAAFLLETCFRFFPPGTVHMVVVDPGVGTERKRLVLRADGHSFVGPDNGCLSAGVPSQARLERRAGAGYETALLGLPAGLEATAVERLELLGVHAPSMTFEGRDVFAPVAAYLARGGEPGNLGTPVETALALPRWSAVLREDGRLEGRVVHVDRFGNVITDITSEVLPEAPVFELGDQRIAGLARTYALADDFAAIVGSSGFVEIALPTGNAARALGAGIGDVVLVSSG